MKKILSILTERIYIQILALVALHSSWGPEFKFICNPVLSCHSCALSWFACPIGVFIHFSGYHVFPFLALGMVLLVGILAGRLLCGWVCPFGFLQDLLYKVPGPKISIPRWMNYFKYLVLIGMVFLIPYFLGEATEFSFCRFCPAAALEVTVPNLVLGGHTSAGWIFYAKMGFLSFVILLAMTSSRSFCRVFCPIGALLAPLNYLSLWIVKVPTENCVSCKRCNTACITDVDPEKRIKKGIPPNKSLDCVVCHDCQKHCRF